jgi:hypothetical protein
MQFHNLLFFKATELAKDDFFLQIRQTVAENLQACGLKFTISPGQFTKSSSPEICYHSIQFSLATVTNNRFSIFHLS